VLKLATEREHLAKADRDIEGDRRIAAQMLLLARLHRDGHETGEAERLLLNFRQTLKAWKAHREEILREIARLDGTRSL
jgi:hypothetical protein